MWQGSEGGAGIQRQEQTMLDLEAPCLPVDVPQSGKLAAVQRILHIQSSSPHEMNRLVAQGKRLATRHECGIILTKQLQTLRWDL